MKRTLMIVAACALAACGVSAAADGGDDTPRKVFVCKYVGTPGVDERLQTGQNPISVSVNAIPLGDVRVGSEFADAQGRSLVIAFDTGQPEPSPDACPQPTSTTTTVKATTTTEKATTTTAKATTTTQPNQTTTTRPTAGLFAIEVEPLCPDGTAPTIEITFGNRPDLDGQTGTLTFSTGGSIPLVFDANGTTTIPYPASAGTGPVTMTYTLGTESVTRSTTFPEACTTATTTTIGVPTSTTTTTPGATTTQPGQTTTSSTSSTSTTSSSTTVPGIGPPPPAPPTTTTLPPVTTAPPPPTPFAFGAAATVCIAEVPTIVINFQNTFPELAGRTGTLTMSDINGNVVSSQPLVYRPNTTVNLLYPGTVVNPDGSIDDVPGWILTDDGLWIRDPSDAYLREGINLTYTVNPTATAFITYPPESSTCANPDGPFTPAPPRLPPTR